LERKVVKKFYEIPEDELRRLVISKIPRVRPPEEKISKSVRQSFAKLLDPSAILRIIKNCEVCNEVASTITQCPYCGRWIGGKLRQADGLFKMKWVHENCFDKNYGCCKVCADFIKENSERFPCQYCETPYYKFQECCPNCGAPQKRVFQGIANKAH